ncbi:MAG: efflux RND transporter periplasmic adaptor subunit [Lysobacteraceae bacterium]
MPHPIRHLVVLLLAGALSACGNGDARPQWRSANVDQGDVRLVIAATGNLKAVSTVDVGAQVSGQIVEVAGEYNQSVAKGEVIARIDPANFEARVAQARADLRSSQANLSAIKANRDDARLTLADARRQLERAKELHGRRLISQNDLDQATLNAEQGQTRLRSAEASIQVGEAAVGQRQAALDNALVELEQTVIRAPVDGVILSRAIEPGQTLASNFQTPVLFTIAEDLRAMQLDLAIDEADIGQIRAGQPVSFSVDAYPEQRFRGEVREVRLAAQATQNVVSYPVIVSLSNPDLRLYPGMTATAEIEIGARRGVLRIANAALRFTPAEEFQQAAGAAAAGQGGAGGAGGGLMALAEGLDLNAGQRAAFEAESAQMRERMRASFEAARAAGIPPNMGGGREAMQQSLRSAIDRLKPLLDAEQRAALDKALDARQQQSAGSAWVAGEGGLLRRVPLRLGLSDGEYTEIVAGPLSAGDAVVIGQVRRP